MKHFTGPRGGNDAFGSAMNSQAHRINMAMSTTAQTVRQISEQTGIPDLDRIRQHMRWLGDRVLQDDGGWSLTPEAFELLRGQADTIRFVTYENRRNPHVTIHVAGCGQIGKKGGKHKYGQGSYRDHSTYSAASQYADGTGLPVRVCFFCRPVADNHGLRDSARSWLPEEVDESEPLFEGAVCRVMVNAYERNPEARERCIEKHGTSCYICGFSFGAVYGELAEGYIHVHHLRPLSKVNREYRVDPVQDLRPVCPNCHAVIHLGGKCRSIEEVKQVLIARHCD